MSYDERQSRKVIIDTPSRVAVALDYLKNLWNGLAGMNLQPSVILSVEFCSESKLEMTGKRRDGCYHTILGPRVVV
jgi:hypothetical protein